MKKLFEIDTKDYNINGTVKVRPSVRAIIIRNNRLAMVHSLQYDYYKFPGGGIEEGENHSETLIHEVREESGLIVIPDTICPFGYVPRIQRGNPEDVFIQDNYYYLCQTKELGVSQNLDDYEAEEQLVLDWVTVKQMLDANRNHFHSRKHKDFRLEIISERECRVAEILLRENLIQNE